MIKAWHTTIVKVWEQYIAIGSNHVIKIITLILL